MRAEVASALSNGVAAPAEFVPLGTGGPPKNIFVIGDAVIKSFTCTRTYR